MNLDIGPYDPCPCGSGKKYKFCCAAKAKANRHGKFPVGTVAYYGPDDKTTTKIAAGVLLRESAEPIMERFVGSNVLNDPAVHEQIKQFFASHGVKTVVMSDGILGCPHEEGEDYPLGQNCPFCPFWADKQGTAAADVAPDEDDGDSLDDDEPDEEFGPDEDFEDEDSDLDGLFERMDAIIGPGENRRELAIAKICAHLKSHLRLPVEVKGIEDFRWEEPYIFGGWDRREHRRLRKTQPSYRDRYQLLDLSCDGWSEWMLFRGEDIAAHVRRISDGKEFVLGLAELEATERKSENYRLLDDYVVWFVNSR